MILSKRERYIGIVASTVLGVLVLDHYLLSPLLEHRTELQNQIAIESRQMERSTRLLANNKRVGQRWREMTTAGLQSDASAAESQVLHSVRDWAQDSGLALSSVKPERTEQDKHFQKITFRATAAGNMNAIGRFIYRIQTASVPMRISDLQITPRKEGTDDLALQLGISTILWLPELDKSLDKTAKTPAPREDRQ